MGRDQVRHVHHLGAEASAQGAAGQADAKLVPNGAKAEVQWVEAVLEKATAKKSEASPNATVMIVQEPGGVRLELSEERHVLWAAKLLRHLDVPGPC